jgi:N-acetylmuramoyl-L-alanine amidase
VLPTSTTRYLALVLATAAFLSAAPPSADKQLSIYAPVATYTLPVQERSGHEYIGLLELLEPLGRVSSDSSGSRWHIRYNNVEAEFTGGKIRCKIHGRDFDLTAPFQIENARGFVPVASLTTLLPRFLGSPVNFHETARRLFVGDTSIQPSFQLENGPPPRLVLNFSEPVNPTIATEPGRLRMVFRRDAVVSPGTSSIVFDNSVISQASYSETNGTAELDIDSTSPLLATFSNGSKTITLAAAPTVSASTSIAAAGTTSPSNQTPSSAPHKPLAVIDPAHGGDERGAALADNLAEKDVSLGFGRLLRHELESRGFAVILLRDGDSTVPLDQRAGAANTARASVFISLHAASEGSGARVYTALMPVEGESRGTFRPWNSAQAPALAMSRIVANAVVNELQKKQFAAHVSPASLRPLNNVLMPALAVELAPGSNGIADLTSANYQQQAAAAIADAVNSTRDRLGMQP